MTELIVIDQKNIEESFTIRGIDPILAKIKEEVRKFVPDTTTPEGRKDIASMAYKVAKSKTYLDDLGKNLTADWKSKAKIVDSARKKVRDELDELKTEVRRPLTEIEDAEKERIILYRGKLDELKDTAKYHGLSLDELKLLYITLDETQINDSWKEYEAAAKMARDTSIAFLNGEINRLIKEKDDQAELLALREKEELREREDRERKIAEEATLKVQKDAEKRAEAEKVRVEAEKQDALNKEAELRKKLEAAELKIKQDAEQAEFNKIAAVAAENARLERIENEKLEAQRLREANIEHMKKINNETLEAISQQTSISEFAAKDLITQIAMNKIPNIKIIY